MIGNERLDTFTTRLVGILCSPLVLFIIPARFSPSKVFIHVQTPLPLLLAFLDTDYFLFLYLLLQSQQSAPVLSYSLDLIGRMNISKGKCTSHVHNKSLRKVWYTDDWMAHWEGWQRPL